MRPYNRSARTRLPSETGGPLVPDRRVTEMLAYSGYTDAAWTLYQQTGDDELLRRTGTDDRIDQVWLSEPLGGAVVGCRYLDKPVDASDHLGLAVTLDLGQADTSTVWEYR